VINRFKEYIRQNNLINKDEEVLLAISGGADSVVMLDLFNKTGMKFAISHCNFKLRMFESDDDELFVRQLAHKYNVEVYVNWCNTKEYAKENKLSTQEAARDLRYAWFNQVCLHNNYGKIAVAHHQDDKLETFIINLFRGAGLKGLKSIPVKRQNIIRPLLFATRKEIEEYAKEYMLEFREDSSNNTDDYLRNKIRHHLIPKMEEISDGSSNSIKRSIENINDADSFLNSIIKKKITEIFVSNPDGTKKIPVREIVNLEPFNTWVFYLLNEFGFIRQITDNICVALLEGNYTGLRFNSPNHELLIDREYLILREVVKKTSLKEYNITENKHYITKPLKINFERQSNQTTFKFSNDKFKAYFDADKITFPLTLRKWQVGDRMIPFGMNGSKLISDILIDNKVNSFEKENVYVILSGKEIIWLVGYRSSNEFRVTESTDNILLMELISSKTGFDLELFR
jgi:tRNA(Ile)-lysidine synthase